MSISQDSSLRHHNVCLMQNTRSSSTPTYFVIDPPYFAQPRHGNAAKSFATGADAMQAIADAIRSATKFIFFVDWQMDYDVELTDRGRPDHPARLTELLVAQLDKHPQLDVRILLYDSIESPAYTHENEVRKYVEMLNNRWERGGPGQPMDGRKRVQVVVQPPNTGRAAENIGFSHHQKMIVVDGKIGFIGGIDVTYGRWDDANFDVVADPLKHRINDMYNPGLGKGRLLTAEEARRTKEFLGEAIPQGYTGRHRPGFASTYYLTTILHDRIKTLWEKGRSIEEIQRLIDLVDVPQTVKNTFVKAYQNFEKKLDAVEKVHDDYTREKALANKDVAEGRVAQGNARSAAADKKLKAIAARQIGKKLDAFKKSMKEWAKGVKESIDNTIADGKYYSNDPQKILDDAQTMWEEIKNLPNYITDTHALEEGCQPRMPWQDVHAQLTGPVVFDLYKNFVRRWNTCYTMADNAGATPLSDAWLQTHGGRAVFGNLAVPAGQGVSIQIVRSMSMPQLEVEWAQAGVHNTMDFELNTPKYQKQLADHRKSVTRHDDGILCAMKNCIKSADAYIYIETQFFISEAGKSARGEEHPSTNGLVKALAARIGEKIAVGQPFHVYIVLPVHPEGSLMAAPVAKQQYWILQTLKHGKKSLIYRICEFLVMKGNGCKAATESEVMIKVKDQEWAPYLTVLNLRNYGFTVLCERHEVSGERLTHKPLGNFVITEQCYVHSKLLIVDDAVVVLGSANVNDRSLNGDGDSEIAAVILDNDKVNGVDLGNGVPVTTRRFARELREKLWKKHFGLMINERPHTSQKIRPAGYDGRTPQTLPSGVVLNKPAAPSTVQAIQQAAGENAAIYETVFRHTPRNSMKKFEDTTDAWPKRWSKTGAGAKVAKTAGIVTGVALRNPGTVLASFGVPSAEMVAPDFGAEPPELQAEYMAPAPPGVARHYAKKIHDLAKARDRLAKLKGFFILMPLDFAMEEKDTWLNGKKGNFLISDRGSDESLMLASQSVDALPHGRIASSEASHTLAASAGEGEHNSEPTA